MIAEYSYPGQELNSDWPGSNASESVQIGPSAVLSTSRPKKERPVRMKRFRRQVEAETGSESEESWQGEYSGTMYQHEGHGVPVGTIAVPFYSPNPARNNGADLEPVPITPVRGQNWPGLQIQLKNGWGQTSFGHKLSYDDYLRLLTDSASKNRKYLIPHPAGIGPNALKPGPAPANVNQLIQNSAGSQPTAPGGPGMIASGVNLSGRTYYG
jgi:hypothetical protein